MIGVTSNYAAACAANRRGGRPIWRLEIDDYARVFTNRSDPLDGGASSWIVSVDDLQQSVDQLEGSSTLGDLNLVLLDYRGLLTADLPTNILEGRRAHFKAGYPGLALADYATLFTGLINSVITGEDGCTYALNIKDMARIAEQVIFTVADDGEPTDSDHPKTLLGNPMDLLLTILRDELGIADHDIGVTRIEAYRDELFGGMQVEFSITSPPEAKNFIEQEILKPLGGFGYTNNLGQYTVDFMQPLNGDVASVLTLDEDVLTGIPSFDQSDLINTISYRFDADDSNKFLAETVQVYGASVDLFGTQGQAVIESQGVRSGFGGFSLARSVSRSIFNRYGLKNPKITSTALWDASLLGMADYVLVQHSKVPNRTTGTMGISQLFQVIDRTFKFEDRTVELIVVDATKMQQFGITKIAPDATPDFTAASVYEKGRYLFCAAPTGLQSDGTPNGRLG